MTSLNVNPSLTADMACPRLRGVLRAAALLLAAIVAPSLAQPAKVPLVAYLTPVVPQNNTDFRLEAFRLGMREQGYEEGRDYRLETRWGEGKLDRMTLLAKELVDLKPDVFVAASGPSILAARQVTRSIPIVMPVSSDPVSEGIVASLARPGGNITGLSNMAPELGAKRVQLLKDVLQKPSRSVVVMWNPAYKGMSARFREASDAAPAVGLNLRSLEVRDAREMESAFDTVSRGHLDGLLVLTDPLTFSMRARIVEFARENRLPAIYESSEFVDAGGLMSYGPNQQAQYRRSAYYVVRILKGAKPAEMPIEQPAKIELVVNMRTAKALRVTIPQRVLAAADRVVE